MQKVSGDDGKKGEKKKVNITINTNENSSEYKKYYYHLERYMMENCLSLQNKVAASDRQNQSSVSENKKAISYFNEAKAAAAAEKYREAATLYKKAVQEDPKFVFAWDNLGLMYRKMNDFDKAIESYNQSFKNRSHRNNAFAEYCCSLHL